MKGDTSAYLKEMRKNRLKAAGNFTAAYLPSICLTTLNKICAKYLKRTENLQRLLAFEDFCVIIEMRIIRFAAGHI